MIGGSLPNIKESVVKGTLSGILKYPFKYRFTGCGYSSRNQRGKNLQDFGFIECFATPFLHNPS